MSQRARIADVLCWAGLIVIMLIAVMRTMIVFAPHIIFDLDPVFDSTPLLGMGPAQSMVLDVLLLIGCAVAIAGLWLSQQRIDFRLLALALFPIAVVCWHGSSSAGNMWLGSTWVAAAVAAVTVWHLSRHPRMRIVIIALLLATLAPLLIRGALQVSIEHQATIAFYEQNKEAFLRDRGWTPDSPSAQVYEQRLRQPQPMGWFASPNTYASLMIAGIVLCAGLIVGSIRARLQSGWTGLVILLCGACACALWFTGSKGAFIAALIGLLFLAIFAWPGAQSRVMRFAPSLAVLILASALLGVVLRGVAVHEDFLHDRSLLFRWHYMTAAAHIFADHPLLGVGPDRFQEAYTLHRPARNPEEVTSAHSVFIDWLCTLGLSAAAWVALLVTMLWRSAKSLQSAFSHAPAALAATELIPLRGILLIAIVIVACGLVPAAALEWSALDGVSLGARVLGLGGYVIIAILVATVCAQCATFAVHLAVLAAAVAVLVHGQIEMTFTQPGSVVWCMVLLGALGAPQQTEGVRKSLVGNGRFAGRTVAMIAVLLCICGFAAWCTIFGVVPARAQDQAMITAARSLAVQSPPTDANAIFERRFRAADELVKAYELWPINVQPLEAAARQLEIASTHVGTQRAIHALQRAMEIIERAIREHNRASSIGAAASIAARVARHTRASDDWENAIKYARESAQRDPRSPHSWRRLGDVLWSAEQRHDAAQAYRTALECNERFSLDPLRQLTADDKQRIQTRVQESDPG